MEKLAPINFAETKDQSFYQVSIRHTDGEVEIIHHISPDYERLNWMLFKGLIRSFEIELDYS